MDGTTIAILGFLSLFVLLFIRVPVGIAMMIVGAIGIFAIRPAASIPVVAGEIFGESSNYPLPWTSPIEKQSNCLSPR